jgi:type II restriction enzyme
VITSNRDRPGFPLGFDEAQAAYSSSPQVVRVTTEAFVKGTAFCPACGHEPLTQQLNNRPASDFVCPHCREEFELKSKNGRFGAKVVDGAYDALCARLTSDTNPNFAFLNYSRSDKSVTDLFVVPKHFVHPAIVERRKPLAATARRAGWIGCNIKLSEIPAKGKVFVIRNGLLADKNEVLRQWQNSLFLREERPEARGWLLDVLWCCEAIGAPEFSLEEIYRYEARLSSIYPGNNNVRPKIRQQLQVLRDAGVLEFVSKGRYRLI